MRAITIQPGQPPRVEEREDSLAAWQGFVGGYIEICSLDGEPGGLRAILNEEGKLMGLPPAAYSAWLGEHLVGPVAILRGGEDGELASVQEGDLQRVYQLLVPPNRRRGADRCPCAGCSAGDCACAGMLDGEARGWCDGDGNCAQSGCTRQAARGVDEGGRTS